MKYKVNDSCIGCGLCESSCPEVFHMNGDVAVAIEGEVPGRQWLPLPKPKKAALWEPLKKRNTKF